MDIQQLFTLFINHRHTGNYPDAPKIPTNFLIVDNGNILKGTYEELKQSISGTQPIFAWATDIKMLFLYTGDVSLGDEGFITLGGTLGGTPSEIDNNNIG